MSFDVSFVVYGEPASKSNSRKFVFNRKTNRPMFIKSDKARNYEKLFRKQCQKLDELITDDVEVQIKIYYKTRRPDLDESLILDLMQDFIYANDRQVKKKVITWGLDKEEPRSHIRVVPFIPDGAKDSCERT